MSVSLSVRGCGQVYFALGDLHGCEKEIVGFGVTVIGRPSVNRRLFSSLSRSCGRGSCQGP